jgi:hypothetical protein
MTDLPRLAEAVERAIPGFDEDGYTEPHIPSLQIIFAAARAVLTGQDVEWCEVHNLPALVDPPQGCSKGWDLWNEYQGEIPHPCRLVSRRLISLKGTE